MLLGPGFMSGAISTTSMTMALFTPVLVRGTMLNAPQQGLAQGSPNPLFPPFTSRALSPLHDLVTKYHQYRPTTPSSVREAGGERQLRKHTREFPGKLSSRVQKYISHDLLMVILGEDFLKPDQHRDIYLPRFDEFQPSQRTCGNFKAMQGHMHLPTG